MDRGVDPKDLTWLPEQDEEKLQLGFRIIQNAFKGKVNVLENEIRALKHSHEEKQHQHAQLTKKNSALEVELIETHQRAQQLAEENKTLLSTVRTLRKQIEKLDRLKKTFMETMDNYHTDPKEADDGSAVLYADETYLRGATPLTLEEARGGGPQRYSTPAQGTGAARYGTEQRTHSPGPSLSRETPGLGMSAPTPGSNAMGGMLSGNNDGGGPGSPVDGKAFFRKARNVLSHESFNAFLANIKRLNNHQQTRDQTLAEAQKIFGNAHSDLYHDFTTLLNRHS